MHGREMLGWMGQYWALGAMATRSVQTCGDVYVCVVYVCVCVGNIFVDTVVDCGCSHDRISTRATGVRYLMVRC